MGVPPSSMGSSHRSRRASFSALR